MFLVPVQIALPRTEGRILRPKQMFGNREILGEYQEQTCYANCGDISQKKSLSFDIEVNLNFD